MNAREAGFTIVEALVAFAILAAVISALYAAAGTSLRVMARGGREAQTALLAQSKLDELSAMRGPLPEAEAGTFAGTDVGWRIETHDLESRSAGPGALRLQSVRLTLKAPGAPPVTVETRHLGARRDQ